MNLEAIAKKLQKDGVGRIGIDIFAGHAQEKKENGILLRDTFNGDPIDYELPGFYRTRFHCIVWSKKYKDGQTLSLKVMKSLTMTDTVLEDMEFRYLRPRNRPNAYPLSEGSTFEFLVIFDGVYVIV